MHYLAVACISEARACIRVWHLFGSGIWRLGSGALRLGAALVSCKALGKFTGRFWCVLFGSGLFLAISGLTDDGLKPLWSMIDGSGRALHG